jgi:hypothetical protein
MKLQTLKQGDKSIEPYYQELLISLSRCGIHEDDQALSVRFFGGLNRDIHDILDYKDWTRFIQLYHLAIKLNMRYMDVVSNFLSGPTLGELFSSVRMLTNPRPPLLLRHHQLCRLLHQLLR